MRTAPAMLDFLSPLSIIPGMGPKRMAAFSDAGITTVGDLLYRFPGRYIDRSIITPVKNAPLHIDSTVTVAGTIESVKIERGKKSRLRAQLTDATGTLELLWFQGVEFQRQKVTKGMHCIATGKISSFNGIQIVHPAIEECPGETHVPAQPVLPLYRLTSAMRETGVHQAFRRKIILWILKQCQHYPETLPASIDDRHGFPPVATCLNELHFPTSLQHLDRYKERIRYEELYRLALDLHFNRTKFRLPGRALTPSPLREKFEATLPFTLTNGQHEAIDLLLHDCASPRRMHRLLQGDVGSGKTVVGFMATLPSLANGLQVVWMAPTELLAEQTWATINTWLIPLGCKAALFTGSSRNSSDYHALCTSLANGSCQFVVGTHALFQPAINFHKVGIFIIDEQHRFGANQRLTLHEKDNAADFLLMSATPIPQTLAQTLYGDLDIVSIRDLPPGRQHVSTHCVEPQKRLAMEEFIAGHLETGKQCFYIVPRIEGDDTSDDTPPDIADIESAFRRITRGVLGPFSTSYIHGKRDSTTKSTILRDFSTGKLSILLATTVVEVGINVPNASIIVIENAEHFGLAQLHQLRGRVGRGSAPAWCFLMLSEECTAETRQRLRTFCSMHNGFSVAELDLQHRGPGEVTGFRQSGWDDLIMADILRDAELFASIRREIDHLLKRHS